MITISSSDLTDSPEVFQKRRVLIGSDPRNDFILSGVGVSDFHLQIHQGRQLRVLSTNQQPIQVDGKDTLSTHPALPCRIKIGNTTLHLTDSRLPGTLEHGNRRSEPALVDHRPQVQKSPPAPPHTSTPPILPQTSPIAEIFLEAEEADGGSGGGQEISTRQEHKGLSLSKKLIALVGIILFINFIAGILDDEAGSGFDSESLPGFVDDDHGLLFPTEPSSFESHAKRTDSRESPRPVKPRPPSLSSPSAPSPLESLVPRTAPLPSTLTNSLAQLKKAATSKFTATKEKPFANSLGMKFVPAGTPGVLFSVWETRRMDYEAYAKANIGVDEEWKEVVGNEALHPVVNVSWEDANAFCAWLTRKERAEGKIGPEDKYRLPSDHEWSCAVGIGRREDPSLTPEAWDQEIQGYPWGVAWPPPRGAGNFSSDIEEYSDAYESTAPVGSFRVDANGLYDLSGNVREWCSDWYSENTKYRVLRGGSWNFNAELYLRSSYRGYNAPRRRFDDGGFRCVVVYMKPPPEPEITTTPPPVEAAHTPEEELTRFIIAFYKSNNTENPATTARKFLADSVNYYGERLSYSQIHSDQKTYFEKWPTREYQITPTDIKLSFNSTRTTVTATTDFRIRLASRVRSLQGRRKGTLKIDVSKNSPQIIAITSTAIGKDMIREAAF